jgi:hypothetical protein
VPGSVQRFSSGLGFRLDGPASVRTLKLRTLNPTGTEP